jgi:hypothetical protein
MKHINPLFSQIQILLTLKQLVRTFSTSLYMFKLQKFDQHNAKYLSTDFKSICQYCIVLTQIMV